MENIRTRTMEKLSLEDYVRFVASDKQYDLTCELLKQVIHMHGFTKGKKAKSILRDALESMELMEATRSTLKDKNVSANAFISMNEVVKDLIELKWQECCITSIQMVNSSNYSSFPLPPSLPNPSVPKCIANATSSSSAKRKKTPLPAAVQDGNTGGEGVEGGGSAESGCCSEQEVPIVETTVVRKARKKMKTLARFVRSPANLD